MQNRTLSLSILMSAALTIPSLAMAAAPVDMRTATIETTPLTEYESTSDVYQTGYESTGEVTQTDYESTGEVTQTDYESTGEVTQTDYESTGEVTQTDYESTDGTNEQLQPYR